MQAPKVLSVSSQRKCVGVMLGEAQSSKLVVEVMEWHVLEAFRGVSLCCLRTLAVVSVSARHSFAGDLWDQGTDLEGGYLAT